MTRGVAENHGFTADMCVVDEASSRAAGLQEYLDRGMHAVNDKLQREVGGRRDENGVERE